MSRRVAQPVGQIKHTNVAIVKLKRARKHFEIACYRNKVVNWRNGVETDLDEVLQTERVFTNVTQGRTAKKADLAKAFKTTNQVEICKIILAEGVLQVSDRERQVQYENLFRDVAAVVAEKCINPASNRPYPVSVIEREMKDSLHYAVNPSRSAKQQALEVIEGLKKHIPLARARMQLKITVPAHAAGGCRRKLKGLGAVIVKERQRWARKAAATAVVIEESAEEAKAGVALGAAAAPELPDAAAAAATAGPGAPAEISAGSAGDAAADAATDAEGGEAVEVEAAIAASSRSLTSLEVLVDPGCFRAIDALVQAHADKGATLEVMDLCVQQTGDAAIDSELARTHVGASAPSVVTHRDGTNAPVAGDSWTEDPKAAQQQQRPATKSRRRRKGRRRRQRDDGAEGAGAGGGSSAEAAGLANAQEAARLEGVRRALGQTSLSNTNRATPAPAADGAAATSGSGDGGSGTAASSATTVADAPFMCRTCTGGFYSRDAHRAHFRSDWHRLNLKRKLRSLPPLCDAEFQLLTDDEVTELLNQRSG